MAPDIIVIGAFKAGTTALHQYLAQHPSIFMTHVKEPNFFAFDEQLTLNVEDFPVRSWHEYQSLFDAARIGQLKGEASPAYLHSPISAERIYSRLPNVKLIASLRNPVDRAYSHYVQNFRAGRTRLSAEEGFNAREFWLNASLYADSIARYEERFSGQLKVILHEDLNRDAAFVVNELFEWLGLSRKEDLNTKQRYNSGGVPKSRLVQTGLHFLRTRKIFKELLPPAVRARLATLRDANLKAAPPLPEGERSRWQAYFREDVLRTQDILDLDLSSWLS